MKFEELLFFQLQLQVLKEENRSVGQGIVLDWDKKKLKALQAKLPFTLTEAQETSLNEILADMRSPYHMNRLLQGDVGKREDRRCWTGHVCCCNSWQASGLDGTDRNPSRATFTKFDLSLS